MRRLGTILIAVMALCAGVLFPATTFAASSNSLGVNPRRDYTIKPGDKVSDTIFVRNLSQTDALDMKIDLVDFQAQNQTGAPQLLLKETHPTSWSLKPYMTIQSTFQLGPGKSAEIPFTIAIPKNVGAGSFYTAIRYSAVGASNGNLNLSGSSTTLVFVRVPGQANDSLRMTAFGAFTPNGDNSDGVYGSFYSATAPKYLSYTLKNTGNVAEQPTGSILLKDTFGKQAKLYQDANPSKNLVLIDQTRRIDFCMNQGEVSKKVNGVDTKVPVCNPFDMKPGHYTALLDLFYGSQGSSAREIKATASFWYLPAWFIVSVIVVLLLLACFVWLILHAIRNRRGKYKNRR
jgi:hypothetical protein